MIRYALVGCGNIGTKRLKSISSNKNSKLVIIAGPKNKSKSCKALELSKSFNCKYTNNWKKIFDEDIDAVILSTPTKLFNKIGSEILNRKKHLLVEKPLGRNINEAKNLTKLAIKNKVLLKTGFNLRFDTGIMKAQKYIIDNKIGKKIYFIKMSYVNGTVLTNNNNVGSLLDIGVHSINLAQFFLNTNTFNNYIKINQINESKNRDDNGFLILKKNNTLISIHHSFVNWQNSFKIEIFGDKGFINIESLPKWGTQIFTFGKRVFPSGKPKIKTFVFNKENSWKNEWEFFIKCIRKKTDNYNLIVKEGYYTMKNANKLF